MCLIPEQTNKKALTTNSQFFVRGAQNVFAIGDCQSNISFSLFFSPNNVFFFPAAFDQRKLIDKCMEIFNAADTEGKGKLSRDQVKQAYEKLLPEYPQLAEYALQLRKLFDKYDVNHDDCLDANEFREMLLFVDSKFKTLPATAQVADQSGKWLGNYLNFVGGRGKDPGPFVYKHSGSFAYVGANRSVLDLGPLGVWSGFFTWVLWRGAYLSMQFSTRSFFNVSVDWFKTFVFGRDISRA